MLHIIYFYYIKLFIYKGNLKSKSDTNDLPLFGDNRGRRSMEDKSAAHRRACLTLGHGPMAEIVGRKTRITNLMSKWFIHNYRALFCCKRLFRFIIVYRIFNVFVRHLIFPVYLVGGSVNPTTLTLKKSRGTKNSSPRNRYSSCNSGRENHSPFPRKLAPLKGNIQCIFCKKIFIKLK